MVSGMISPASANPAMTSVNQCRSHQIMAAPTRAPSAAAVLSAIRRARPPGSGMSTARRGRNRRTRSWCARTGRRPAACPARVLVAGIGPPDRDLRGHDDGENEHDAGHRGEQRAQAAAAEGDIAGDGQQYRDGEPDVAEIDQDAGGRGRAGLEPAPVRRVRRAMHGMVNALVHRDQRAVGQDVDRQEGQDQQQAAGQQPRVPQPGCRSHRRGAVAGRASFIAPRLPAVAIARAVPREEGLRRQCPPQALVVTGRAAARPA